MSTASLMKHKSSLTRRRFILIFLLSTILTVSFMTGFSHGLGGDDNIYSANGERIVMWAELPESGTPDDYDLISNLKFTAQKLYTAEYFRGDTLGTVTANVGLGIKYNQNVHNTRVKKGNAIFAEAISSSALKSVAEQKYFYGDEIILFRPAESVSGDNATYDNVVGRLELDSYFAAYGVRPNELAKHCINKDSIISATDANVMSKAAANSDGDDDFDFDEPERLTKDENGNYSVRLVLDPAESTKYNRNEVRTLAGADQNPVFYSVQMTITFNSAWEPISVKTDENYDIAIPVLGAMNCTSSLTETFYDINDPDGVIPEKEFFESHLDAKDMQLGGASSSPADYLAAAFADYLDGSKSLDLKADISVGSLSLDSVMASLSLSSPIRVKAMLGSVAVEYGDDKLKLKLNDIKGYLPVSALDGITNDAAVQSILGDGLLSDISSIIGPDILSKVFEDCEMKETDGVQSIHLNFALSDDIRVNAYIYIRDEDKELLSIEGALRLYGKDVIIKVVPETSSFPDMSDCTQDLSPIVDYIPAILDFGAKETYGIKGTLNVSDKEVGVNAYIDRTGGELKLQAEIEGFGTKIPLTYVDGTVYFKVGNFALKLNVNNIEELTKTLEYTGIDLSVLQFSDVSLTKTLFTALDSIKSISFTNDSATLNVDLLGVPSSLSLIKSGGKLKGAKVSVDADINGKRIYGEGDFELYTPEKRKVQVDPDKYINVIAVADLVKPITDLVNEGKTAKSLALKVAGRLELDGGYLDITCDDLTVALDGSYFNATIKLGDQIGLQAVYTSGALYIKLGVLSDGVIDDEKCFALSLDKSTDFERLSDILAQYLPDYLVTELNKLLGVSGEAKVAAEGGTSASDIELLIKRLGGMNGTSATDVIDALLSPIDDENTADKSTVLSKLLNMLELHYNNQAVTATATAAGFSVAVTPTIQNRKITGCKVSLSTTKSEGNGVSSSSSVGVFNVTDLELSKTSVTGQKPSGNFISVMEYVELINNIANTFTTAAGISVDDVIGGADAIDAQDKLTTFEIPAISEDSPVTYNVKKIITDENGIERIEKNGDEPVYENRIKISTYEGLSLLKGRIEKSAETGTTDIMLEAHLLLDIETLKDTYGTIKLDLYVKDGCAYLKYREGKSGMGETMSIDFESVSQILAAALKILGVDGSLVDDIFGENSVDIDADVFKSMNIPGFDDIRSAVGGMAETALSVKTALGHVGKAWAVINECTSINELSSRFDELSSHLSAALGAFKKENATAPASQAQGKASEPLDLSVLAGVLGGVKLGVTEDNGEKTLYADIDNSVTVKPQFSAGTGKNARISVKETTDLTDERGKKNVVKGIAVSNLDVKTAILDGAIEFIAGDPNVTIAVPDDITQNVYDGDKEVSTYSDLSDIKHLLFDVMNTANLMKFEMGGGDGDIISLKIGSYTVPITFKALVEIIPTEDATAKTPFETVAAISLHTDYNFGVTYNATTYMYVYKNKIYLHGIDSINLIGKVSYKDWVYTTDDLGALFSDIKNGFMPKFLYRMLALSSAVKSAINSAVPDGSENTDPSLKTIAQIFTGYKYEKLDAEAENSPYVHTIGLHLGNLLGNTTMQGITVQLRGANNEDDDENVANNYIQHLYVSGVLAKFLGLNVTVNLVATLENVKENTEIYVENGVEKTRVVSIEPKALSPLNGAYMSLSDVPSGTGSAKLIFDDFTDGNGAVVKSVINETSWTPYE